MARSRSTGARSSGRTAAAGQPGRRPRAPGLGFDDVRRLAADLAGVEEATAFGSPCLKVSKTMFACIAINKQAEPNTLMVRIPIDQRDELIEADPGAYYVTPHYEPFPCVLVRLGAVHRDALRDLLHGAWRSAAAKATARRRRPAPRR